ncbi:MAG: hypothetical protein WD077_07485 [Bacteroidia bacterium]
MKAKKVAGVILGAGALGYAAKKIFSQFQYKNSNLMNNECYPPEDYVEWWPYFEFISPLQVKIHMKVPLENPGHSASVNPATALKNYHEVDIQMTGTDGQLTDYNFTVDFTGQTSAVVMAVVTDNTGKKRGKQVSLSKYGN